MIEVERIIKYYGPKKAVENVSFSVNSGEILGLLGPNGAGKTTIMRILTCFIPATSGSARVAGYDIIENPIEVKRRIGYLPEFPPVYNEMTVENYLSFCAEIKELGRLQKYKYIEEAMLKMDLMDVRKRIIGRLSRGFRQRVGLAQALLTNPEILILDEPTVGLDPKQIIEIRQLIKSLKKEHTIILSSHILPEVTMTCDRIAVIDNGSIIAIDTQEQLAAKLKGSGRVSAKIRGPEDGILEKIKKIEGVVSVEIINKGEVIEISAECDPDIDIREDVFRTVVKNKWSILELKNVPMSLEDVFMKLTKEEKQEEL